MINLGTLKEISDLRSIWPHEALNFTPWVAENVELLADAVGLDITVDETEELETGSGNCHMCGIIKWMYGRKRTEKKYRA